jgi:hypothetical protein
MENGIFNQLLDAFMNYKGIGYVSLQYRNAQKELSKCLYNVGAKLENAKKRDIKTLTEGIAYVHSELYTKADWDMALTESMKSLVSPDKVRSDGQINAYAVVNKSNGSVRVNYETLEIYLFAKQEDKVVLEKGEYPVVNSRAKTIAKNVIKKSLMSAKFRTLIIRNMVGTVKINSQVINIDGVDRIEDVLEIVEA